MGAQADGRSGILHRAVELVQDQDMGAIMLPGSALVRLGAAKTQLPVEVSHGVVAISIASNKVHE